MTEAQDAYNEGVYHIEAKRLSDAVTAFERAVQLNPDFQEAHYNLGTAFALQGQYENALSAIQHAIRLNPHDIGAYKNLKVTFEMLGRREDVIETCRQLVQLDLSDPQAHFELGDQLIRQVELKAPFALMKEHNVRLNIPPEDKEHDKLLNRHMHETYNIAARLEEAVSALNNAVTLKRDFLYAHVNLGAAYTLLQRHEDAISAYERAIQIEPNSAALHHDAGKAHLELGRYEAAIMAFNRAVEIDPNYVNAHCSLGTCYAKCNDLKSFHRVLKKLQKLDSASAAKLRQVAQIKDAKENDAKKGCLTSLILTCAMLGVGGAWLWAVFFS